MVTDSLRRPGHEGVTTWLFGQYADTPRRGSSASDFAAMPDGGEVLLPAASKGGRNAHGRITTRHQGGGHGVPLIDFTSRQGRRQLRSHRYDPNRTARIALLHYADGEKHTSSRRRTCSKAT
jgi:ribosomal protein L2